MSDSPNSEHTDAESSPDTVPVRGFSAWQNRELLQTVGWVIVILAGGWWFLRELSVVLRPLLIAVFMCYVMLPSYSRLRRNKVPAGVAITVLAGTAIGLLFGLGLIVYASLVDLSSDAPALKRRALELFAGAEAFMKDYLPWVKQSRTDGNANQLADILPAMIKFCVAMAFDVLIEVAIASLYLLFLLLGAERLPSKIRKAYPKERADNLLQVAGHINSAIISYLKAKVLSSLIFALPVVVLMWGFEVKFAIMWAVLTFICNFIPYIGSAVALAVPIAFAILQLGFGWPVIWLMVLLVLVHVVCAMLIEPMLIGRAVGISPLVVLAALAVWGLIWGLPGMALAVPLTVVVKLVLANLPLTRSIAKLMEE